MQRPVDLPHDNLINRRRLLACGAGLLSGGAALANDGSGRSSHFPFGPVVPPLTLQAWPVTTHLGASADLAALLSGKTSALQLMFAGCSATCPIQGALFASAQRALKGTPGQLQFVSLSIDALGDTPAALAAWLQRFGAAPGWWAAVPSPREVDAIVQRLSSGGQPRPPGPDPHPGQVYVFDRRARLVYRTPSMPTPAQIVAALREVDALDSRKSS